ncbi:MAG: serine/threonine protein kinase [Deltaproteobacteria bacterium]|nr:serine/threonine protein kinase [Deltaproteobacteria bacterium]
MRRNLASDGDGMANDSHKHSQDGRQGQAPPAQGQPPLGATRAGPGRKAAEPTGDFLPTVPMDVVPAASAAPANVPVLVPPPGGPAPPARPALRKPATHKVTRIEWTSGKPLSGRYVMVDQLGEGGMGTVYLAEDLLLRRKVAVKTLWDEDLFEAADIERLRKEVAMAHSVSHPNVARTYDLGEAGGVHYITMEALRGETLMDRIRRGPNLTSDEVRDMAIPLCLGLRAAHRVGVVHRDLKPANIMLVGGDRKVAIMDFGIAAAVSEMIESPSMTRRPDGKAPSTWEVTSAGLGTPVYMAPEQWDSQTGDARTDIYSLGVILYVCLTGDAPYVAETNEAIAEMHKSAPVPSVAKRAPGVDADLAALIGDCLAKDAAKRPQSMDEVIERLQRPARRKTYVLQMAAGTIATALLLSLLGVALYALVASSVIQELRPSLRRLAELTARQLDPADLDQIRTAQDITGPAFAKLKATMRRIEAENRDVHYLYVFRAGATASRWTYVYDTYHETADLNHNGKIDANSDEEADPPGKFFDSGPYPAMNAARESGKSTADQDFSADDWRVSISGYSPLPVGQAKAPYLVGCDVTSETLVALRQRLLLLLGIAQLAAMIAMGLILAPQRQLARALRLADETARKRED